MKLNRVTITGADDSIRPEHLVPLTQKYPFVEWAILLSQSSEGKYRFPSLDWMKALAPIAKENNMQLAGHLCGRWVRDVCAGSWNFIVERPDLPAMFQRIQINFHAEVHKINHTPF